MMSVHMLTETNGGILATLIDMLGVALYLTLRSPQSLRVDKSGKPIKPRRIPSLDGSLPVLGDLFEVLPNQHRLHTWMWERCQQFDCQPWRMKIPGQPQFFIFSSPDQFEEVLATQFGNFPKGEYQLDLVTAYFGKSLVASDGERWYHQRKTAAKFFTARSLRAYMATSAKRNLIQVMDTIEAKQQVGEPYHVVPGLHDADVCGDRTGREAGLDRKGDTAPFQQALDESSALVAKRFSLPTWLWRLQRKLNVGDEAKLAKNMSMVKSWLAEVVTKSLEACVAKADTAKTEIGELEMKSMVELFAENSREDADGLRTEDLVGFIQAMVFAARDTTAIALTWFFTI